MSKTNNDYLAEYVREKRPEIERSLDYIMWKIGRTLIDAVHSLTEQLKKMSPQELEELNQQIIGKDGIAYCDEACCQKAENDEIQ